MLIQEKINIAMKINDINNFNFSHKEKVINNSITNNFQELYEEQ